MLVEAPVSGYNKPMYIPSDPTILLSFINMKLRDSGASLDELCGQLDMDRQDLSAKLAAAGYQYDEKTNQFR